MGLYDVKLQNVDELLDVLSVKSVSGDRQSLNIARRLDALVRNYLKGTGHPEDDAIRSFVGEDFEKQRENPLLRSHVFLRAATTVPFVPVGLEVKVRQQC